MKWKNFFNTKTLCRAGVIAALYVALTYAFGAIAYQGIFEIRPAEALTILPLFFPEAVPALYIGCMLANIGSQFWVYDVFVGSLATLVAALGTWAVGKLIKKDWLRMVLGGLFPVVINAVVIPFVIILAAVWVYALGTPLYISIRRLQKRGVRVLLPYNSSNMTEQS
jgi:uncharacterized membrane protein